MSSYHDILEHRRKRIEKAERALDLLADPDITNQLANDQELRDAFLRLITGIGNHVSANTALGAEAITRVRPPEGSQLRAVLDAAAQEIGDFTTKALVERMRVNRYQFAADDPQIAVN